MLGLLLMYFISCKILDLNIEDCNEIITTKETKSKKDEKPNKNKIEIKRSNSDESLTIEKKYRRNSNIRFSIVNEDSTDSNKSHHENTRRKSLHPSEAFVTSEEVNKARKLSIFPSNQTWNNKSNQRITAHRSSVASTGMFVYI